MQNQFSRTQLLLGAEAMDKLKTAHVAIFGIGGVGGYVVEALARAGVGHFDLIDDDVVCLTNINRQIHATIKTVGHPKVEAGKERVLLINPHAEVETHQTFFLPDTKDQFDFTKWDYVVDAVDTVTAKLLIIEEAQKAGVPVISCMGCGNRLDPSKLEITDIYKTVKDPLSKVMRRELKKRGVKKCTVLYSTETALSPIEDPEISCREHCVCPPNSPRSCNDRRAIPASSPFVPPAAGLMIASKVAMDLIGFDHAAREKEDLEKKLKKRELFRAGRALREKLKDA
ncbi:MAG: tRNA threonylcarbamoyladenosine dehydratase [Lachnospiraceae bacterium]|nr:tRNA threonylcarbamoyladenosine dehydratase [Lachnospiraceae bacterium]MDY3990586.1 tRNA threonylcarbamoyladenosine dehydratase [Lachnospiraceae bacterium]